MWLSEFLAVRHRTFQTFQSQRCSESWETTGAPTPGDVSAPRPKLADTWLGSTYCGTQAPRHRPYLSGHQNNEPLSFKLQEPHVFSPPLNACIQAPVFRYGIVIGLGGGSERRRSGEALFGRNSLSLARRTWPRLALLEGPLWLVACGE
jgi:hypothetical protein